MFLSIQIITLGLHYLAGVMKHLNFSIQVLRYRETYSLYVSILNLICKILDWAEFVFVSCDGEWAHDVTTEQV